MRASLGRPRQFCQWRNWQTRPLRSERSGWLRSALRTETSAARSMTYSRRAGRMRCISRRERERLEAREAVEIGEADVPFVDYDDRHDGLE